MILNKKCFNIVFIKTIIMENKLNYRDEQLQRVVMNTLTEIFKDNVSKPVLGGKTLTDNDEGYLDFLDRVSSYVNHLKENI